MLIILMLYFNKLVLSNNIKADILYMISKSKNFNKRINSVFSNWKNSKKQNKNMIIPVIKLHFWTAKY
jgi:hypothetical protein